MNKLTVQFSKSAKGRRGWGNYSWKQVEAVFRMAGMLLEGQHFEKVEVDKKGLRFTTSKTGHQKG